MRCFPCTVLALVGLATLAGAQETAFDPTPALAPYVDELTYAVGVVDAANIDFAGMAARLVRVGVPRDEINDLKKLAPTLRDALVQAGGRYVCFTFNLDDPLEQGPLLVIPVAAGGRPQDVAAIFAVAPAMKVKTVDRAVLVGSAASVERALKRKAANRPELARALAAVAPLPTRLALALPPPLARSLEELVPTIPAPLGGGPMAPVTRGLEWAAVGLDLSADKAQLRAVVQARDAAAAAKVGQLGDRALALLRQEARQHQDAALGKALELVRPELRETQLRLTLDAQALDMALLPLIARVRLQASLAQSANNLKQIGLAMHVYHDVHKTFPPQASYGKDGKALLSWRVHLLPYLEQKALYDQFKLDEPWDSAHNQKLIGKMPAVYRSPFIVDAPAGRTTYLVPTGPDLLFDGPKTSKMSQITDGTSNTILAVEAAESKAVPWTKPADDPVDRKAPRAGLLLPGGLGFLVVLADGATRLLPADTSDETMWHLFTPADGK